MIEMARADLQILIAVEGCSHQGPFQQSAKGGDFSRSFRRHNSETFWGCGERRIAAHRCALLPDCIQTHPRSYAALESILSFCSLRLSLWSSRSALGESKLACSLLTEVSPSLGYSSASSLDRLGCQSSNQPK
jgi:hypothetical protein